MSEETEKNEKSILEEKRQKRKTKVLIASIIIIFLIILEVSVGFLSGIKNSFFKLVGITPKEGNTIGNISNYGYVAEDNKYLYYMCPSENGQYIGISKIKKDDISSEPERLIEGAWELTGINVLDDYIYFVTLADLESDTDSVDNKIHRMKKDGSKHEVINDNEFNNNCFQIFAIDNKVYYIGIDDCIYYMDLDGSHKTKLNENKSGFIGINDDYIFYNMYVEVAGSDTTKTVTYRMDRDGQNSQALNGEKMYTINVLDDYIYYVNSDKYIHRMKIDGTEDEMLSDKAAYNLNVTEDGIFFINYYYVDDEPAGIAIYKMDLDGNNLKELNRLEETTNALCVTNDWVLYLDGNDDEGRIELMTLDGKQKNIIFSMDYSNYYYLTDSEEEETSGDNNTTDETDSDGTVETTEN